MSAPSTLVSLATYLQSSYSPDCDFVGGEVEKRSVGEYPHSKLLLRIGAWFVQHEREWRIDPLTEQRIRVSADQVRVCDLCVLRSDAPREAVTQTPPLLCIEILSAEDRIPRTELVLADYRQMGVAHIWMIDPIRRTAYTFDTKGLHLVPTARLEIAGTPIFLPLDDLFSTLD
jgi:Uma2 family endonuclease